MIQRGPLKSPATRKREPEWSIEVENSSVLIDADWTEINKLKLAFHTGRKKGLAKAMRKLRADDSIQYLRIMAALIPEKVREAIHDELAANGLDQEEIRKMVQKLDYPSLKKH